MLSLNNFLNFGILYRIYVCCSTHIVLGLVGQCKMTNTHDATAAKYDEEALDGAGSADYPCQTDKEDHTKDVLDTRQVDTYESAHSSSTPCGRSRFSIRVGRSRDGVAVISQAVEQRRDPRPILHLLLQVFTSTVSNVVSAMF